LFRELNGDLLPPGAARAQVERTPPPIGPDSDFPQIRGYELLSIVGSGGMGIVYEARHVELNRRVAIKMLRGEALADPVFRDRFRAEAEAIARLQHPNIIQVFEVGATEPELDGVPPNPFLALEFVDGGSLAQHTLNPHPPREAARLVETLARAAHAAHELGIVHRDLKPANVLLTRDGVPKIADFGIAKRLDGAVDAPRHTVAGTVMGTPEYMAPEQLKGCPPSPVIDIYSLGVILYELLTARVPFQGATFADTMLSAVRQEPVSPRQLQPGVPRDLETICLKCLEKNPARRYASAEALADELARWIGGHAIRSRPVGPAGRTARWAQRNPTAAVLLVAVILVAVAGVAGVVWKWDEASTNAARAQDNALRATAAAHDASAMAAEATRAAAKERWERYRMSVFAAASALQSHDITAARRALDDAPENHRDWVWDLLSAQLDRSRHSVPLEGVHQNSVRYTQDGRWALGTAGARAIHLWDLTTQRQIVPVRDEPVRATGINPAGTVLAFHPGDNTIVLCAAATGGNRHILRGHTDNPHEFLFTPDGTHLLSLGNRSARLWDVRTAQALHVFEAPTGAGAPLFVTPDLRFVIARWAGSKVPRVWERETGRELGRLEGHGDQLLTMFPGPTGESVVTVEPYPNNVMRLWALPSCKLLATMRGHENLVCHAGFSPDGRWLVSSSQDRTVRVWDLTQAPVAGDLAPRHVLSGHKGWVNRAYFSADGARITSASEDGTLRYWDARTGRLIAVFRGHTRGVVSATGRADGSTIVSCAHDGTLRVWDVGAAEHNFAIRAHDRFVYSAAWHPDGVRLATAGWDGTARIRNTATGRQLLVLDHRTESVESMMVSSVAFHPSGKMLASLTRDDGVLLWDAETGARLHRWTVPSRNFVDSRVSFSPDGTLLAAGSWDGRVRLWNVATRAEYGLAAHHEAGNRDVAFSPDGRWIASSGDDGDRTVQVCAVATRERVQVLRGHKHSVYALAWNRDATLLASAASDGAVFLWDVATWQKVGELRNGVPVYSLAFTPNGALLAAGCIDNLIRLWDVGHRQELAELSGHESYVHALAFTPDGSRLVSGSGDGTIRIWDARAARRSREPVISNQ
jgi:WD40 repeat protein/tRNA A-37 threonylcarbamoyl transferase component Bud32